MKYIKKYNEAFGSKISYYNRRVRNIILDIICSKNNIENKKLKEEIKESIDDIFFYNPEVDDAVRRFENNKKSEEDCASHIIKWFIK